MNNLLQLKGEFSPAKRNFGGGERQLHKGYKITIEDIARLIDNLNEIVNYWDKKTEINGVLLSIHYKRTIPKSSRVQTLINNSDTTIRGSKYETYGNEKAHVFIHYLTFPQLEHMKKLLTLCDNTVKSLGLREITQTILNTLKYNYHFKDLNFKKFSGIIMDISEIAKFDVPENKDIDTTENQLITIYKTDDNIKPKDLLNKLGITILNMNIFSDDTFLLDSNQITALKNTAPYLIAMHVEDITKITLNTPTSGNKMPSKIPAPTTEPIIGVFDTLFDNHVYFSEWVDYVPCVSETIADHSFKNTSHGTTVDSIIIDGPSLNPNLEDNCGRFRVKHFGVAVDGQNSTLHIMQQVQKAVSQNPNIKVWNFSLGNDEEINENFISAEAALLDDIQKEYDVTFIISGTNNNKLDKHNYRIGSPADSINSIVVNSVTKNKVPVSYTRTGPVLSFFTKPDCCYYGGEINEFGEIIDPIYACDSSGRKEVAGTSYAAPWITRKIAYMRYKLGFSKEIAKALLLDACIGWEKQTKNITKIGHGIVPKKIEDIVTCNKDEIKFFVEAVAEEYATFSYNLPVPLHQDRHPFKAKVTMCYFPKCVRSQGVDYTATELDLHFGRIQPNKKAENGVNIKSINNNYQNEDLEGIAGTTESEARNEYGKWDNVKHIGEVIPKSPRSVINTLNGMWGIKVNKTERLKTFKEKHLKFGIVVTLKEITGKDRTAEFVQQCNAKGWIVHPIELENMVNIYNKGEEDIELE